MAGVILYGVVCRIRTSRALEEALLVRSDFRWLVEGRTIDHTTISEFRRTNSEPLKKLFVQIALVAAQMGRLPLKTLGFDGTRLRADNRKGGTRTPEELRQAKAELEAQFAELEAQDGRGRRGRRRASGQGERPLHRQGTDGRPASAATHRPGIGGAETHRGRRREDAQAAAAHRPAGPADAQQGRRLRASGGNELRNAGDYGSPTAPARDLPS